MISNQKHSYYRTELPKEGDTVRVRSASEIRKMLNSVGGLDYVWEGKGISLAFTEHMWKMCGQSFRVLSVSRNKGLCLLASGPGISDEWWFCNEMLEWN